MTHLLLPLQARVNHSQKKPSESLVCGWGQRKWQTAEVEVYVTPLKMLVRMALLAVGLVLNKILKECVNEFFFICAIATMKEYRMTLTMRRHYKKGCLNILPVDWRNFKKCECAALICHWLAKIRIHYFRFFWHLKLDGFILEHPKKKKKRSGDAGHGQHSF